MIQITKKSALALAVTTALWGATAVADNNDTATATVSGTVIASLAIANTTDMTLPTVVLPDSGETSTAGFTCSNTGTATAAYDALGGNPYAHGTAAAPTSDAASANVIGSVGNSTGICAEFAVSGENSYHYALTHSISTALTETGLSLGSLLCISESDSTALTGTIGAGGDKIHCGAQVSVLDTASAGSISSGVITLAVVYD